MRHRIPLLLVLVASATAAAAPGKGRVITDDELKPYFKEYAKRIREVQAGRLKPGDLVQLYAQEKQKPNISRRQKAIRTFMFGTVSLAVGKDWKAARRAFEEAKTLWPDFPSAYVALAQIAERADDLAAVKRLLKKALAVDPEYLDAILFLGRVALRENKKATNELDKAKALDRAEHLFKQSMEVNVTGQACMGLQEVYTRRWKAAVIDEDHAKWARKAINMGRAHVELEPKSGIAHILRAKVFKDLGDLSKAIDSLEDSLAKYELEEKWRLEILAQLLDCYKRRVDVDNFRKTIERVLKIESIDAAQRERLEQMLKDIKDKGRASFAIWTIDRLIEVLKNDLISVDVRERALGQLLEILERPDILQIPELRPKGIEIFRAVFRVLVDAPADVAVTTLRWIRQHIEDPNLTRILVHFIYPNTDKKHTPDVRVEAVRALDLSCGDAALPALFSSLSDPDGRVVREVDKALARLCERRSLVGGGIAPLTDDEIRIARKEWLAYLRTDEAAGRIAKAYEKLASLVTGDESRGQKSAPMVDHAINVILLDNDVKWPAWEAAYTFLLKYWGKDFRPPEARGRPVAPSDRAAIVKRLGPFWNNSRPEEESKVVTPGEKSDANVAKKDARVEDMPPTEEKEEKDD